MSNDCHISMHSIVLTMCVIAWKWSTHISVRHQQTCKQVVQTTSYVPVFRSRHTTTTTFQSMVSYFKCTYGMHKVCLYLSLLQTCKQVVQTTIFYMSNDKIQANDHHISKYSTTPTVYVWPAHSLLIFEIVLVSGWPSTKERASQGWIFLGKFHVLPHWDRNRPSHAITVYWRWKSLDLNSVKLNSWAVPLYQVAHCRLHLISTRCATRDLHTIVPGPLERTCWRQFAAQWRDCKNFKLCLSMWLL